MDIKNAFNNNENTTINYISNTRLSLIQIKHWKETTLNRANAIINIIIDWSFQANDVKHIMYGVDEKELEWFLDGSDASFKMYLNGFEDSISQLKFISPKLGVAAMNFCTAINNWRINFKLYSLMKEDYEREIGLRKAQFKEYRDKIEDIFDEIINVMSEERI